MVSAVVRLARVSPQAPGSRECEKIEGSRDTPNAQPRASAGGWENWPKTGVSGIFDLNLLLPVRWAGGPPGFFHSPSSPSTAPRPFRAGRAMLFLALLVFARLALSETRIAELSRTARAIEFDEERCYRVREMNFQKEDAKFYLTDGYLILSKPVAGLPMAAAFSAEVEGGEAELLLLPPNRGERLSLASFTQSPNLEERFHRAVFLFTDGTAEQWEKQMASAEVPFKTSTEMGLVLKQRFESVTRNLVSSFEVRILQDLLSSRRREKGLFYAALGGAKLGNFDVFVDQRGRRLVTLGQVATREQGSLFDIWTQFEGRSRRDQAGPRTATADWDPRLDDFRIEATVHPDLRMEATTRMKATVADASEGAMPFEISSRVRITEARIDGEPAEVFQRDSLRATLMAGGQNELVLIVPPHPLIAGHTYEVELKHEGSVIREAGNGVFFVGSRANWHPQRGLQMARYEATFRYPKALTLVSAGESVEEKTEGEWRISRWKTPVPVRLLGFNLGTFERSTQTRGDYKIQVYANRQMEGTPPSMPPLMAPMPAPGLPRGPRRNDAPVMLTPAPAPSPLARLTRLAGELGEVFDFMAAQLGPPPLKTVNVTPIPGRFGQGFPGLLYLSTLNYLDPAAQAAAVKSEGALYFEILQAHEIAHQWWGNLVTPGASEDDWLMEGLANYTALLYLEKKRGVKTLDAVLETYKQRLLKTGDDGKTVESAGPIVWGSRLSSSQMPQAWQAITYEKGSWILHMLRRRMGDPAFSKLLGELTRRYALAPLTNADLQRVAAEQLPGDLSTAKSSALTIAAFFDTWVYGTGVPGFQLQHKTAATRAGVVVTGTVTQTGAGEDFTAEVPVEITLGRGRSITHWVKTSSDPVDFSVRLPAGVLPAQVKVALDPANWLLRR